MNSFDAMLVVAILVMCSLLLRKPVEDRKARGLVIEGCSFVESGVEPVRIGDGSGLKVEGCEFRGDGYGVEVAR